MSVTTTQQDAAALKSIDSKKQLPADINSSQQQLRPAISPEELIARAIDKGVDVDALEKLLAMREKLERSAARKSFALAFAKFQRECPIVGKSQEGKGAKFSYKYANIADIVAAVREPLSINGLSYYYENRFDDNTVVSVCVVQHVDGWSQRSEFYAPIDNTARMNIIQKGGSSNTYGNRYALCNALGIALGAEDDDAQSFNNQPQHSVHKYTDDEKRSIVNKSREARRSANEQIKKYQQKQGALVTDGQIKRLFAILNEHNMKPRIGWIKLRIKGHWPECGGVFEKLTREQYDTLIDKIPEWAAQIEAKEERLAIQSEQTQRDGIDAYNDAMNATKADIAEHKTISAGTNGGQ